MRSSGLCWTVWLLEASGAIVTVVMPDAASLAAIGDNVLDATRAAASARAGLEQGLALGASLLPVWRTT